MTFKFWRYINGINRQLTLLINCKLEEFIAKVGEITESGFENFPEWGTWLNEEIEEVVEPGKVAMWWLGNTRYLVKTKKIQIFV